MSITRKTGKIGINELFDRVANLEAQVNAFIEIERRNFYKASQMLSDEDIEKAWEHHRINDLKIP